MPRTYWLESLLQRCGVLGVLSRRLWSCGKIVSLPEGQGCQSGGHASGLTIQLSQGQGRQPLVPKGAPPAAGVPRSHATRAFDCSGRRQDKTPERGVSTEKLFLFCCVVAVPSLGLSFQTLSPLVVSIPAWLWQLTITHR
jgi:hypothetical protein